MKIGTTELLVILLIVLLIFGPTQLPKLTKMLGKTVKKTRQEMNSKEADADPADKASGSDTQ